MGLADLNAVPTLIIVLRQTENSLPFQASDPNLVHIRILNEPLEGPAVPLHNETAISGNGTLVFQIDQPVIGHLLGQEHIQTRPGIGQ